MNSGPCFVEEQGSGTMYQWRLKFDDGSVVTVVEDTAARRIGRAWKIECGATIKVRIPRQSG